MSKKANRRAARQAFPKAKSAPAPTRGRYGGGARGRTSAGSRQRTSAGARGRGPGGGQTLRPPTIKKAVITGVILAFGYFALIQWGWHSGASTNQNIFIALIAFVLYASVSYAVERWKYQRKLRKVKGPSK